MAGPEVEPQFLIGWPFQMGSYSMLMDGTGNCQCMSTHAPLDGWTHVMHSRCPYFKHFDSSFEL